MRNDERSKSYQVHLAKCCIDIALSVGSSYLSKFFSVGLNISVLVGCAFMGLNCLSLGLIMGNASFAPVAVLAENVMSMGITIEGGVGYSCGLGFGFFIYMIKSILELRSDIKEIRLEQEKEENVTKLNEDIGNLNIQVGNLNAEIGRLNEEKGKLNEEIAKLKLEISGPLI
ncbi:hypothetical protein M5689_002434 [Euphorbia peplus]|nr:hypothetical protein M5689_002434 [Euphorbia peplus]